MSFLVYRPLKDRERVASTLNKQLNRFQKRSIVMHKDSKNQSVCNTDLYTNLYAKDSNHKNLMQNAGNEADLFSPSKQKNPTKKSLFNSMSQKRSMGGKSDPYKDVFYYFKRFITDNKKGAIDLLNAFLRKGFKVQIVAPTGSGKTAFCFGEKGKNYPNICDYIANNKELSHYNIVLITPLSTLATNTYERAKFQGFSVIVKGQERAKDIHLTSGKNRIVCTYKQAATLHARLSDQPTVWIIDEIPETINAQYQSIPDIEHILKGNEKDIIVGLTATPHVSLFEIVWGFKTFNLKSKNPNKPTLHITKTKKSNFADTVLSIAKKSSRKLMAFINSCEGCNSTATTLNEHGISASSIHAETENNEQHEDIISLNTTKEIISHVVCTTSYLSIGIDGRGFDIIYIANGTVGNNLQHLLQAVARSRDCKNVYLILQDSDGKNNPKNPIKNYNLESIKAKVAKTQLFADYLNKKTQQSREEMRELGMDSDYSIDLAASTKNEEREILYKDSLGRFGSSILIELNYWLKKISQSTSNDEFLQQIKAFNCFVCNDFINDGTQQTETTKAQQQAEKEQKKQDKELFQGYALTRIESNLMGIDVLCEYVFFNTEDIGTKKNILNHNIHVQSSGGKGVSGEYERIKDCELFKTRFTMISAIVRRYCELQSIVGNSLSFELYTKLIGQNTNEYSQSIATLRNEVRELAENTISNKLHLRHIIRAYDHRERIFNDLIRKEIARIDKGQKIDYLDIWKAYNSILKHSRYEPIDTGKNNSMRHILKHLRTLYEVDTNQQRKELTLKILDRLVIDQSTQNKLLSKLHKYRQRINEATTKKVARQRLKHNIGVQAKIA